ncbi:MULTISPECIES: SPOR domain-containing protein [unclassified Pseudomonas]|uniref:SPOR domain-containing protein n=1 Tax=unclassified Pseudomonas TaxID=196821 RepID=UPI000C882CE4|nr:MULTISPECIES: SPOR domain-containing protein [unclassified Pseudomonas]PMZ87567.1 penicillin-binding protein activator LpoB [Pseudomonas sp. FW215-T2]PNA16571.1 penicillin-binding protein activator LpoB [Pseudomonas sp. FW215-R3]PNB35810.1 penicillin-binding protein activator LpoB [Pseudomonas sp. FW305-131]
MRKMVLIIAILALAGCGEGNRVDAPKPKPAMAAVPAPVSGPQWDLEVRGETPQAVSDLSGWLIEHSFMSSVVKENGNTRILVGPFSSKAEAEAKQDEVRAALTRSKKQNIELLVLERPAAQ